MLDLRRTHQGCLEKTAELLSEAYGIDEKFTIKILNETYVGNRSTLPDPDFVDGEPLLPEDLDVLFSPNIYQALRDMPVQDVVQLFKNEQDRSNIKEIEDSFFEMQSMYLLTPFDYLAEIAPSYLRNIHYARRTLRQNKGMGRFTIKCATINYYFFDYLRPKSVATEHRFDRDSVEMKSQSMYAKLYFEYMKEHNPRNFNFNEAILDSGIVETLSSKSIVPKYLNAPKSPIKGEDFSIMKKERYGDVWTSFLFDDFVGRKHNDDFSNFSIKDWEGAVFSFRDFIRNQATIALEAQLREAVVDFIKISLKKMIPHLTSLKVQTNLYRDLALILKNHSVAKFLPTLFNEDLSIWNLPKMASDVRIRYKDRRIENILLFAKIIDIESKYGLISEFQKYLRDLFSVKYGNADGDHDYFSTTLYRSIEDLKSTNDHKIDSDNRALSTRLEMFRKSSLAFQQFKKILLSDENKISTRNLEALLTEPETGFRFGANFESYKNYKNRIEMSFTRTQADFIKILYVAGCFSADKTMRTTEIIGKIYSRDEAISKRKRLSSASPFRIETEIFSMKHPAVMSGLIKRGKSLPIEKMKIKDRTYFLDCSLDKDKVEKSDWSLKKWLKSKRKASQDNKDDRRAKSRKTKKRIENI